MLLLTKQAASPASTPVRCIPADRGRGGGGAMLPTHARYAGGGGE